MRRLRAVVGVGEIIAIRLCAAAFSAGLRSCGKTVIVFGSRNREFVTDSSLEVYLRLARDPSFSCFWVTTVARRRSLRREGIRAVADCGFFHSILLRCASLAVISYQVTDVAAEYEKIPGHLRFLYLGHGKSIKRSGMASKGPRCDEYKHKAAILHRQVIAATATSQRQAEVLRTCYGLGRCPTEITGEPRTDYFFRKTAEGTSRFTFLYAPTWRQGPNRQMSRFFPFTDFDAERLISYLREKDIRLILRPHPKDVSRARDDEGLGRLLSANEDRISLFLDVDFNALYKLVPQTHLLISDYSSLVEEYLLLDKPIVLIPYDATRFEEEQGFLYDLKTVAPGEIVGSFAELLDCWDVVVRGGDLAASRRRSRRNDVHKFIDGRSSSRVADLVVRLCERHGTELIDWNNREELRS